MQHVMIDLETLSTRPDAAIISIGACQFDPLLGHIGQCFYARVDFTSAVANGHVSGDTIKWRLQQSEEARSEVVRDGEDLQQVLQNFATWLPQDCIVWGNGATFDISILNHAYGHQPPWNYRNIRDMRTLVHFAGDGVGFTDIEHGGKHHALHDAMYQARVVCRIWEAYEARKQNSFYRYMSLGSALEHGENFRRQLWRDVKDADEAEARGG